MQKTGVLDLVGTVIYPPGHHTVCNGVSSEKNHDHVNRHGGDRVPLTFSEGANKHLP